MALKTIEGGGVPEPDWKAVFDDEIDQELAHEQFRLIVNELAATEKLAAVNAHQIKRLAIAYVQYEVALRHVVEQGAITLSKKGTQIYNPWWTIQQQAASAAADLEAELTISPRRRTNGGKAQKRAGQATGAQAYLHTKKS
jgi:P27 family predicted phage terminase small subunit